jgi:hypothetical protein
MKPVRVTWSPGLIAIAIVLVGVGLRTAWLFHNKEGFVPPLTESQRIGVSLATTGHFADAFRLGSGPTAHVSPVIPWMIGLIYMVAGVGSPASEFILSIYSIGLISLSFWLTFLIFKELGASDFGRYLALGLAALFPFQPSLEARELRVWEAPLVVAAVAGLLLWALRLDKRQRISWLTLVPLVLYGAVLFLVSPPGGLTAFAIIGLLAVRRAPPIHWPAVIATTVALTIVVSLPWARRNQSVMGRLIWTRSNAGLELGLAYNDTLAFRPDHHAAYLARLHEMHPAAGDLGYAAMQKAGGEVVYAEQIGAHAKAWIQAHPVAALDLFVRHMGEYILPPEWFFHTWGHGGAGIDMRRFLLAGIMLLGIAVLPLRLLKDTRYLYIAAALGLLAAPYVVVQPILRYRYLVSTLILFLACDGLSGPLVALWRRVASGAVGGAPGAQKTKTMS